MSSEIAIKVENLSKCYQIYDKPRDRLLQMLTRGRKQYFREFWALREVSFEIKKGETVGIIGRNGSGKSTLLQMICGTLNPTSGSIQTQGHIAALLELGSGFNPEFTGRENIYMNAAVLGLSKEETDTRFDDIVLFADIGDFIEQPVKTYSSGMTVRLAFSVAINVQPEILIIDEALSVGDELFQRKCFSRIEAIKQSGSTILFVSHSGAQIVELCDRAILLDSGNKLAIGLPKNIIGQYQKLLYSPQKIQDVIRNEICVSSDSSLNNSPLIFLTDKTTEYFDQNFKPSSTIRYEPKGANIESPIIKTLSGQKINQLKGGEKYIYCYRVNFNRTVSYVRFGMVIKTPTGFSLGGALSTSSKNTIPVVNAGSIISVEFSFECSLNPGIYFMNAGVFGVIDTEETVLHRIVDAIVFRVSPVENQLATELINFGCIARIKFYE